MHGVCTSMVTLAACVGWIQPGEALGHAETPASEAPADAGEAPAAVPSPVPHVEATAPFHLFNPTPREKMRGMSADRPDGTESPITVDAGHYQVEISFADYETDGKRDRKAETWTIMDTNLKAGLTDIVDLQVVFSAHTVEQATGSHASGFSDVQVRIKVNVWGNDGGSTAFGVMPFVKIPTGTEVSNNELESGLMAMIGIELTDAVGVAFMAELDSVYDAEADEHGFELAHTAVVGLDFLDPVGIYLEYIGVVAVGGDDSNYQAIASGGITIGIHDSLQFDVGTMVGITTNANDFKLFGGMTYRL